MKRDALAWIAAALAPVAFAGCHAAASPRPASSVLPEWGPPQPGDPAPELVLPSLRGSTVKLSSSRGHWVLLHFTASWVSILRDAEITHLDEIAAARAKDGLVVLVVDVREPLEALGFVCQGQGLAGRGAALRSHRGCRAPFRPPRARPEFHERADRHLRFDPPRGSQGGRANVSHARLGALRPDVPRRARGAPRRRSTTGAASGPPPARVARIDGMLDASRVVSISGAAGHRPTRRPR